MEELNKSCSGPRREANPLPEPLSWPRCNITLIAPGSGSHPQPLGPYLQGAGCPQKGIGVKRWDEFCRAPFTHDLPLTALPPAPVLVTTFDVSLASIK
ncbi:hypothetical protein E2C01_080227 [Portunus trituberculatus]|uniref:Uncharacterized protein n=1 Tax=Portunus trituberculatus TaxID=210409 RepID=A0A5B7ITH7_PORTR|nr:hypothetical protein [Portunus trituberculatus]